MKKKSSDNLEKQIVKIEELLQKVQSFEKGIFLFHQRLRGRIFLNKMGLHRMMAPPETPVIRMKAQDFKRIIADEEPELYERLVGVQLPSHVLVLELLTERQLLRAKPEHVYWRYWSWIVVGELMGMWEDLPLTASDVRTKIGHTTFEGLRTFLTRERYFFDPEDDDELAMTIVAWWAMLGVFAPKMRQAMFPTIEGEAFDAWLEQSGLQVQKAVENSRPKVDLKLSTRLALPPTKPIPSWQHPSWIEYLHSEDAQEAAVQCQRDFEEIWEEKKVAPAKKTSARSFIMEMTLLIFSNLWSWLKVQVWSRSFLRLAYLAKKWQFLKKMMVRHITRIQIFEFRHHLRWTKREMARGNSVEAALQLSAAIFFYHSLHQEEDKLSRRLEEERQKLCEDIYEQFITAHKITDKKDKEALQEMIQQLVTVPLDTSTGRQFAALLKSVQRSYLDREREFYATRLFRWLKSFGRKNIKIKLQNHGYIRSLYYLQDAQKKLDFLEIPEETKEKWLEVLRSATEQLEEEIREIFGRRILMAMDNAHFRPANHRERIARIKIRDELLDIIIKRGKFNFSDVRDVISRNDMRIKDPSWKELLFGDQLIQLDKEFGKVFYEVYRKSEFYLRWLQRLTSFSFGTPTGRWIFRYVLTPFGGAAILLAALEHLIIHPIYEKLLGYTDSIDVMTPFLIFLTGGLLFLIIHTETGALIFKQILGGIANSIRFLFMESPRWVLKQQKIQGILKHRNAYLTYRWLFLPLLSGLLLGTTLYFFLSYIANLWMGIIKPISSIDWWFWLAKEWPYYYKIIIEFYSIKLVWWQFVAFWFVISQFFINVSIGRAIWDWFSYRLIAFWYKVRDQWVIGIVQLIMAFFQQLLISLDYVIYRVDDLLRFHQDEGKYIIFFKAIGQVVWSFITYIIRFLINLVVEPQINPIKHFPVVTISHKIIIPYSILVLNFMRNGGFSGWTIAVVTLIFQFALPGISGFLAWEFRENWKEFSANKPEHYVPVRVGSHGETVDALLRRGFHSGTLPKLYEKFYHACNKEFIQYDRERIRHIEEKLHHVRLDLKVFLEREFLSALQSREELREKFQHFSHEKIIVGQNHIDLYFVLAGLEEKEGAYRWRLRLELESGWLLADLQELERPPEDSPLRFSSEERELVNYDLVSFLFKSGVRLVRGKLEKQLAFYHRDYEVAPPALRDLPKYAEYWVKREQVIVRLIDQSHPYTVLTDIIRYHLDDEGKLYEPAPLVALTEKDRILMS